ncbi:MAG TPA: hypothetical protein PLL66_09705 [Bacteroidales bacterium]|nr:hypothetical protein [Bacteroidales bacterium]
MQFLVLTRMHEPKARHRRTIEQTNRGTEEQTNYEQYDNARTSSNKPLPSH